MNENRYWGSELKAIETRYKGRRFRSRLEARWAVYFDSIGCKWDYEPEGFHLPDGTMYLPDFWLSSVGMWAEVKPKWPTNDEIQKAFLLAKGTGHDVLFLDGTPRDTNYWSVGVDKVWMNGEDISPSVPCWNDYLLVFYKGPRFYSCWGGCEDLKGDDRPDQTNMWTHDVPIAVEAGRSARFEHGENGGAR